MRGLIIPPLNKLLYWGIILMIIKVSFSLSAIIYYNDYIDTALSLGASMIMFVSILKQKHSIRSLLVYAIITIIALYSTVKTGNYGFLITIITILAIREEKFDYIIEIILKYELIFFVMHTIVAIYLYVFGNYAITTLISGQIRLNFGFKHPNTFSIYLFNLIMMWTWLNYGRIGYKNIFILFGISIISYCFTKTRTAFFDFIILIVLLIVSKEQRYKNRLLTIIAGCLVPFLALFILILAINYTSGNKIIRAIDWILSHRILLGAYGYAHYGITGFGNNISEMVVEWDSFWGLTYHTFDCIYTYFAMNQGVIWLIIISVLFFRLANMGNSKINICLIIWAFYGVTEVHGLNGYLCFPILLIVLLLKPKVPEVRNYKIRLEEDR